VNTVVSRAKDVVVVGSGPNGLAAAITLADAGHNVTVIEMAGTVGGGVRSAELTLPGFVHDVCSAIHPFGRTSGFFREHTQELAAAGLRWIEPPVAIGHPLDDGPAVILHPKVEHTAAELGRDADAYRSLLNPLVNRWDELLPHMLAPFHVPWGPLTALRMARFGLRAITSAEGAVKRFKGQRARALFAGAAAHSILPFSERFSAAAGMVMLASAHADGWPFPEGGSGNLSDALAAILEARGGEIRTGKHVNRLSDLPDYDAVVFDVSPQALAEIATDKLHGSYRSALKRYRYGPGVFKVDIAIDGDIPWKDDPLRQAGTVHLGGTFEEIARSEAEVASGRPPEKPFVLLVQQSLFDRSRAPEGKNAVWAYCHVPNGSTADMTERILDQIERFAPGFRDTILATHVSTPADLAAYNPNYVGGDIAGGRFDLRQLFNRPARPWNPYSTPDPEIFICSASTPPGAGVHGMSGFHAAQSVLKHLRG
jgi:phytoene dehydrogenase-like protein